MWYLQLNYPEISPVASTAAAMVISSSHNILQCHFDSIMHIGGWYIHFACFGNRFIKEINESPISSSI